MPNSGRQLLQRAVAAENLAQLLGADRLVGAVADPRAHRAPEALALQLRYHALHATVFFNQRTDHLGHFGADHPTQDAFE